MSEKFNNIHPTDIKDNSFKLIGKDWMLITAGNLESFNTMTASWGSMGVLWEKNVCTCFIRPQRHTFGFVDNHDYFTLSFFEEKYRSVLDFCGSRSGKDVNKATATGLNPIEDSTGCVYFKEARLVIICKKIYFQDFNPDNFLSETIHKHYTKNDYHRMFIGEVWNCLIK